MFFLLSYATGLTRWRPEEEFPYAEDEDLFAVIAGFFEAEVTRAERFGLVRDYREREESLTTLRGRPDMAAQVRARQGRPLPLECRYQDYTEDIVLNRVLRAAFARLLAVPGLDAALASRLRRRSRGIREVAAVAYSPAAVPDLGFTRLTRPWESAFRLARLILRQESLRDEAGVRLGPALTVDMNRVFEAFVEAVVGREARRYGLTIETQARRRLSAGVPMRPDIVLRAGGDVAVVDAKHKRLTSQAWPNADLYQLLACCVGLGLPAGTLVYAESERPRDETVPAVTAPLAEPRVRGIDLSGAPADVLERASVVAREIARTAARSRSSGRQVHAA